VENGKPLVEPYVMRIGLKPLVAGKYTVQWHAMSADGHETDGRYTFTVSIPSAP
jgi:methionine-rich copper-binding protein CopC